MKRAIFDDFGDLKGIIGEKGAKSVATLEKPSYKSLQSGKLSYTDIGRHIY